MVDAFTSRPFGGNPAAVVVLDQPADPAWMQAVAAEFNLSETAFVHPDGDGWRLRWFTPAVEVDLCGHATLASAHVLLQDGAGEQVVFETRSGPLTCLRTADGAISMDFPADPATDPIDLGAVERAIGGPVVSAAAGRFFVVAELGEVASIDALTPDLGAVAALGDGALIATARVGDSTVACRVFAPGVGIPEDPVTGSAWCALALWWAERVGPRFTGQQRSARGGTLQVTLRGDRVELAGHAVTISSGALQA